MHRWATKSLVLPLFSILIAGCNRVLPLAQPALAPAVAPQTLHVVPLLDFGGKKGGINKIGDTDGLGFVGDPKTGLFNATQLGGNFYCDCGVVYALVPSTGKYPYKERVLHTFVVLHDSGAYPSGRLVEDTAGNLIGATSAGGTHYKGEVFKVVKAGGYRRLGIIHSFAGGVNDGSSPIAPVVFEQNGAIYGVTYQGGGSGGSGYGWGTIFKLTPSKFHYSESPLHVFTGIPDGGYPLAGIAVKNGTLYGTTWSGGTNCDGRTRDGCGTVFRIGTDGSGYRVIHRFAKLATGEHPNTTLTVDDAGNIYGAAGGAYSGACLNGCGTIYKLTPRGSNYTFSLLHAFTQGNFGRSNALALRDGFLYGTSIFGPGTKCSASSGEEPRSNGCGFIFRISPSGANFSNLYQFPGANGAYPNSSLFFTRGLFYATTFGGGTSRAGIAFAFRPPK